MPGSEEFRELLFEIFQIGATRGQTWVIVHAGDLHSKLGGYPNGGNHRIPVCCEVMRGAMRPGDVIVGEPPKGRGASLTIRYQTARSADSGGQR
jgi:hypothetical protein